MKEERILDVLGKVDEKYIKEADPEVKAKRKAPAWTKWVAMAACLCFIVAATIPLLQHQPAGNQDEANKIVVSENGVTIPKLDVSLSNNGDADMIGFFIYHGNCYVQYEWFDNAESIVGEYLGTATGLIDEWTPKEGYVELAGSVRGDFYSVNGYDPNFMLCMKYDDGQVSTYLCNTGITIKYGSELYEDRLHLSENYSAVQFETQESWCYSKDEFHSVNGDTKIIQSFLNALNAAEFIPWTDVPEKEGYTTSSIYDTEIYHVYFQMDNGVFFHLRLYENGYVRFQGMSDICVQLAPDDYNPFVELMEKSM
jgi:hypothetical protein